MKTTGKHKDIRSKQALPTSYLNRIIIRAVKVVVIIIGAVIWIALWAIAPLYLENRLAHFNPYRNRGLTH